MRSERTIVRCHGRRQTDPGSIETELTPGISWLVPLVLAVMRCAALVHGAVNRCEVIRHSELAIQLAADRPWRRRGSDTPVTIQDGGDLLAQGNHQWDNTRTSPNEVHTDSGMKIIPCLSLLCPGYAGFQCVGEAGGIVQLILE